MIYIPDDEANTRHIPRPEVPEGKRTNVSAIKEAALRRMARRVEKTETPIPLLWSNLADALGGGLWPGLHVLVGNTGSGKTQLALQIALHAAQHQIPVCYIGLELGHLDFIARLLGLLTDQKWSDLYLGKNNALAMIYEKQQAALDQLDHLPLDIQVAPSMGWGYPELMKIADEMRKQYPETLDSDQKPIEGSRPFLIILDFLQLVSGDDRELRERIGKAAYAGRNIARTYNASVLLISSTSRENYGKLDGGEKPGEGNPARMVGMGKESGEIEFAANSVLVLVKEPWPDSTPPVGGSRCWIAIAKIREGTPKWVELNFNGSKFSLPAHYQLQNGKHVSHHVDFDY